MTNTSRSSPSISASRAGRSPPPASQSSRNRTRRSRPDGVNKRKTRMLAHPGLSSCHCRQTKSVAVDGVLQALACGKLRDVAGRDVDLFAGRNIATDRGFAAADGEVAETDETDIA